MYKYRVFPFWRGFSMSLKGERLIFREFAPNDFHLFHSVFTNESIMKYTLIDKFMAEEPLIPYFEKVLEHNAAVGNRIAYEYAIFTASDEAFIGFCDIEIHNRNSLGGCGEIGYLLLPAFWGNGYATEIARALIEFCFTCLHLHRVSARCNSNNLPSEKVMRKAGMTKEGELRKVRFKNSMWDNELLYSILIEEWGQNHN
jgi:[ribosomal protein S5]-alanine N-acetyltransferase